MTLKNINYIVQLLRIGLKLQPEHTTGDEKRYNMQEDILTGFKRIRID